MSDRRYIGSSLSVGVPKAAAAAEVRSYLLRHNQCYHCYATIHFITVSEFFFIDKQVADSSIIVVRAYRSMLLCLHAKNNGGR